MRGGILRVAPELLLQALCLPDGLEIIDAELVTGATGATVDITITGDEPTLPEGQAGDGMPHITAELESVPAVEFTTAATGLRAKFVRFREQLQPKPITDEQRKAFIKEWGNTYTGTR